MYIATCRAYGEGDTGVVGQPSHQIRRRWLPATPPFDIHFDKNELTQPIFKNYHYR